jgi:predicted ATPase/DNA-binding SARP family transcriptional activator
MLEIKLLGQFEVRIAGQPVELPSRPAQALLAYLALTPGRAHRREQVAGLLWPDSSEANARGYLRQALWRVRKELQPADPFVADDLTLTFIATSDCSVDVVELEREVTPETSADDLICSLSVYHGPLLPGFYYDWVQPERDRLQAVFENKLSLLLDRLITEGHWPTVLEWGERWIALGHAPEPAFRALMLAHQGLGDRSSAAATYRRCVDALQRELGVNPSPTTRSLYETILSSEGFKDRSQEVLAQERSRYFAAVTRSELPRQLTSFIGRAHELAEVQRLLTAPGQGRLLTLIGVGGSGKTRLALQASQAVRDHFPEGLWFVDLAPLADSALVPKTVAAALGLVEEPGRPILTLLIDGIRARHGLLILDNCEHLINASADLTDTLLRACPNLSILASSREALGVSGETVFQVPSLAVPDLRQPLSVEALSDYESVSLFVDRALTAFPNFALTPQNAEAVAQICFRLDGIPLAIELAAARVKLLSPEQIADRLSDRFRLLTGGSRTVLPRQQTLRATMDWSYNLLSPTEHIVLRRLSVFVGGWLLDSAEAVVADSLPSSESITAEDVLDLLTQLVNKSLVIAEQCPDEVRYRLLETIRQYAREKLLDATEVEVEVVRARHLDYFTALAERAEPQLAGPQQVQWLDRLEAELDNLRAALEWALVSNVSAGLRLASALARFWDAHNYNREGGEWLSQLLQRPEALLDVPVRARALAFQSLLLGMPGKKSVAQSSAETALALYRSLGDKWGEAYCLMLCGASWSMDGDIILGRSLLEQSISIFESLDNKLSLAEALNWLSMDHRESQAAREVLQRSLQLNRQLGHLAGIASDLVGLAQQYYWDGDYESGERWLAEALALQQELGSQTGQAWVYENYGNLMFRRGDYARAQEFYAKSATLNEGVGHVHGILWAQTNLAYIALRTGQIEQARSMLAETVQGFREAHITIGVIYSIEGLAGLAAQTRHLEKAARLLGWANTLRDVIGDTRPHSEQLDLDRDLAPLFTGLSESQRNAALTSGKTLTLDQAVDYALNES